MDVTDAGHLNNDTTTKKNTWYDAAWFRWLQLVLIVGLLSSTVYLLVDRKNSANSGSSSGTTSGTPDPTAAFELENHYCPIPDNGWTAPSYAKMDQFTEACVVINNEADKIKLQGALTIPAGPGPFPVVVLVGGSGPTNMDASDASSVNKMYKDVAYGLSSQGVAVLRYNKRSAQPSADPLNNVQCGLDALTNFKDYVNAFFGMNTVQNEYIKDALCALGQVGSFSSKLDMNKLTLAGHSEGAQIAPQLARDAEAKGIQISAVVLLASIVENFSQISVWQWYYLYGFDESKLNSTNAQYRMLQSPYIDTSWIGIGTGAYQVPSSYYQSLDPYSDPPNTVEQLTQPVLVMQGKADYNVPYDLPTLPYGIYVSSFMSPEVGWNAKFSTSPRVTLKTYDNLCHYFWYVDVSKNPLGVPLSWPSLQTPENHVQEDVLTDMATWIKINA